MTGRFSFNFVPNRRRRLSSGGTNHANKHNFSSSEIAMLTKKFKGSNKDLLQGRERMISLRLESVINMLDSCPNRYLVRLRCSLFVKLSIENSVCRNALVFVSTTVQQVHDCVTLLVLNSCLKSQSTLTGG